MLWKLILPGSFGSFKNVITEKLNVTQRAWRLIIHFYFTLCFDTGCCHVTQAVLVPTMYPRQASNCDNLPASASSMLELEPRNTILGLFLCVCMFMCVRVCVYMLMQINTAVYMEERKQSNILLKWSYMHLWYAWLIMWLLEGKLWSSWLYSMCC